MIGRKRKKKVFVFLSNQSSARHKRIEACRVLFSGIDINQVSEQDIFF